MKYRRNKDYRHQIHHNFLRYARLWRYALARGLSFAHKYMRKCQACVAALTYWPIEVHELVTTGVHARWTP